MTAGIDFGAAFFLNALLDLQWGFDTRPWHTIVLFAAILVLHGVLNQFGVRLVALLNNVSVWWHIIGVLIIVGVLAFAPSHHQSASCVFGHFVNNTGWGSKFYVLLLGLLLAQYTFTGYDASAHMTEETSDAATVRPARHRHLDRGLAVRRLAAADRDHVRHPELLRRGRRRPCPPAQIFIDALGDTGAKLLLLVVIVAQLFCGMSSVTANSRMIYAFSRDGALPGSKFWHQVNPKTRTPTNAIWLAAGGALILGLPYLWNSTAYVAVTSIAVIGLYVAYVLPTFLRLRLGSASSAARGTSAGGRARSGSSRASGWCSSSCCSCCPPCRRSPAHELQLHGGRRRGGGRLRRDLVAGLRAQVVHRPEGPGHRPRNWPRSRLNWSHSPEWTSKRCAWRSAARRSTPSSSP